MMPRAAGRAAPAIKIAVLALLLVLVAGLAGIPTAGEVAAQGTEDYASGKNPNLIDIKTLAQLDAVRYDLNSDGTPDDSGNAAAYGLAFPNALTGMGCAATCTGYELLNSLDFDTNGNGFTHTEGSGDAEDDYYNAGNGWSPIGGLYRATFHGNGHTIDNLFMRISSAQDRDYTGLFNDLDSSGDITALGVRNAYVDMADGLTIHRIGILVGKSNGDIVACYTTGYVRGYRWVGGLLGFMNDNNSTLKASYSTASVVATSVAATESEAGGLVGEAWQGTITGSYYAGNAPSGRERGGLAGSAGSGGGSSISTDTYWDTDTTGLSNSAGQGNPGGTGKTTEELQAPTYYVTAETDIYKD